MPVVVCCCRLLPLLVPAAPLGSPSQPQPGPARPTPLQLNAARDQLAAARRERDDVAARLKADIFELETSLQRCAGEGPLRVGPGPAGPSGTRCAPASFALLVLDLRHASTASRFKTHRERDGRAAEAQEKIGVIGSLRDELLQVRDQARAAQVRAWLQG